MSHRRRVSRPTQETHPIRWAAFLCTINPNTGDEEDKLRLINLFKTLLTHPKFRFRVAKPAFGTRFTPQEVQLVLLTNQTNVSIERENGLHAHVYFIWAWKRQRTKNEFQVNVQLVRELLSLAVGADAVRASHIHVDFSRTNPNIYALDMLQEHSHFFRLQNLHPPRPHHESRHANQENPPTARVLY